MTAKDLNLQARKRIDEILATVLKDVKPTKDEINEATTYSNEIMARLKKAAPKDVEIIFAGSVARGTQIRGNSDIDIFLLFPKGTSKKTIGEKGLQIGKKIVAKHKNESYVIKYAEHPYLRLMLGDMGIKVDIVPAFKITDASERITAVDRTQLHNKFINGSLTLKQKDDVRILKAFLKAHGVYGAEAKTAGISGYLCELLVHQYGSFTALLAAISRLQVPCLIDPLSKSEYLSTSDAAKAASKKFNKGFVVIDPTDPDRNVAAVVTEESLARFVTISKLFLKKPTLEFFYGPKYSDAYSERQINKLRKDLGLSIYLLHFKAPDIAEDIIWQQASRLEHSISSILKKNGFETLFSFSHVAKDDALVAFFLNTQSLGYTLVKGPSAFMGDSIMKFLASHKNAYGVIFEADKISALEKSSHDTAEGLMHEILKENTEIFPSYIDRKKVRLYVNDIPEELAKVLHAEFVEKTSI